MKYLFFLLYLNFFHTLQIKNNIDFIKNIIKNNKNFFRNYSLLTLSILFSQKNFLKNFSFVEMNETKECLSKINNLQKNKNNNYLDSLNKINFTEEKLKELLNKNVNINEYNDLDKKENEFSNNISFEDKLKKILIYEINKEEINKKVNHYIKFFTEDPVNFFTNYLKNSDVNLSNDQILSKGVIFLKNILNYFDENNSNESNNESNKNESNNESNKIIKNYKKLITELEKKTLKDNFYDYILNLKNPKNFSNFDLIFSSTFSSIFGIIGSNFLEKKNINLPLYLPISFPLLFSFLKHLNKELFSNKIKSIIDDKTKIDISSNVKYVNYKTLDEKTNNFLEKQFNIFILLNKENHFYKDYKSIKNFIDELIKNNNSNNTISIKDLNNKNIYEIIFIINYSIKNLEKIKKENKLLAKKSNELEENLKNLKSFLIYKYIDKDKEEEEEK